MKKGLLLFFAFLLPVGVFLFLHFFGKNEFELQAWHQTPSELIPTDCNFEYSFPYRVAQSQIPITTASLVFFEGDLSKEVREESRFQLGRIENEVKAKFPVYFVSNTGEDSDGVILLDSLGYTIQKRCIFIMGENRAVLLDDNQIIRGYYKDGSMKEVDRIILEAKILFREY